MTPRRRRRPAAVLATLLTVSCNDSGPSPTAPSEGSSFLSGTWRGTVTIQADPENPNAPAAVSAATSWTFEVVPGTNRQSFRATIRTDHPWLPISTVATTALIPGNTPPSHISTLGDYASPRGCRGTFGSVGIVEIRRIDADFTGVDCDVTFRGRVALAKD
ncbi:MAG: hypothetical protein AB7I50_20885 [Vicinamibacterales bacterium]